MKLFSLYLDLCPKIKFNPLIKRAMAYCLDDWVEFRTEITLKELDDDIEELHTQWDKEEAKNLEYIFSEEEPDGSEAQRFTRWSYETQRPLEFR